MDKLPTNRLVVFLAVTGLAATLDLWTKQIAFDQLGLFGRTGWILDTWVRFEFHTNLNEGALWGMGQGFAKGFAALSVVAFAGIVYWLFVMKAAASLWLTFALSLVCGGIIGNLYDRLGMHGVCLPGQSQPALAVRDFIHFQFGPLDWAIFNVADICLVTGAIMLMWQSVTQPEIDASAISESPAETP